jgi:hypothetical protein
MGVWVYECMGVWVYECMGVWVYGCMGVWMYACCVSVWLCGCIAMLCRTSSGGSFFCELSVPPGPTWYEFQNFSAIGRKGPSVLEESCAGYEYRVGYELCAGYEYRVCRAQRMSIAHVVRSV